MSQSPVGSRVVTWHVVLMVAMACGAVILYAVDPVQAQWLPKCPLYVLTGWYCPGCGSTRAAHALLHGDVSEALAKNSLLVCVAPLFLGVWAWNRRPGRNDQGAWSTAVPARWIWCGLAVLLAYSLLRNIPAYPFVLLAPH